MHHGFRWRLKVALAFAVVYLVWGSTYLAIRIGVETLPPLLFAGIRFLVAGVILAVFARLSGQNFPRAPGEWRTVFVVGILLLACANGLVAWGEQWVPSNQAALIAATTALWLSGLGALGAGGQRLGLRSAFGLAVGFGGVILLLAPRSGFVPDRFSGQLAILVAGLSWASGSIYMKRRKPATPPLMSAALQSLAAGTLLCAAALLLGEAGGWTWNAKAALALAYLVVFGSCFAYAAYMWLLHTVSPAALSTYAYVNPAVAAVLGWWILNESLGPYQVAGMVIILCAVLLVSTARPAVAA